MSIRHRNKDPPLLRYSWDPFAVGEDLMLLSSGGVNYWHEVIASQLDRVEEGTRVRMEKTAD